MALDLAAASDVLKEFYLAPVREQLNQASKFLEQLEKNSTDIQGKYAYVPIHIGRNSGIASIADGGALPDAGNQDYEPEKVPLRFSVGRFKVTGPTIRATRTDDGSFIRAVSSEMKGVVQDLKVDRNRQVFGDGTGAIATFGVTAAGDVLNLAATTTATQMRQIQRGMRIDIGTLAAPTQASVSAAGLLVVSVDATNKTVTVSAGTGVVTAATHFLFRHLNGGVLGGSTQREITGLAAQIKASGTLFNVNPSTVPEWVSIVDSAAANRQLTEDLIQKITDNVEIASGNTPELWIGSYGVVRSFANQIAATKRIVNTVALKAGWTGIELATTGGAFAKDKDCQENTAYAITTSEFQHYRAADYAFADYDGRTLRNSPGFDGWEGFVVVDDEFATSQRNAHALVTQLSE